MELASQFLFVSLGTCNFDQFSKILTSNRLDYKAQLTAWRRAVGGGTQQQRQKRKECPHLNPTPGACPEGTKQTLEQPRKPTLMTTDVATPRGTALAFALAN